MLEKFLPRIEFDSYEDFKANYRVLIPHGFNFAYDVVDVWAEQEPEKRALLYCNDHGVRKYYTFSDMKASSNRVANYLLSLGIRKGDRVMLILKRCPEVWICILALHKIGAVCVPVTYQTEKEFIYCVDAAGISMVITLDESELIDAITSAQKQCKTLKHYAIVGDRIPDGFCNFRKEMQTRSDQLERIYNDENDPMLLYFSSGTTGLPKMILHDYTYPLGHILTAKYWQQVKENELHLSITDSGWAKFAWGNLYGQWLCGAVIVAYDSDKFNTQNILELIQESKITTFCAPPNVYRCLVGKAAHYDLSSIRRYTVTGEYLHPEVFRKWKQLTGLPLTEGFGQSETSVLVANYDGFPIKPGSAGKPSADYDVDIVDDHGVPCEDGILGHVVIRNLSSHYPIGLFKGYQKNPNASEKVFHNDSYDTGDLAWRDVDGYYWFEGRHSDVIKCSGYRIIPFEVENALMLHPSVLECAVTSVPDAVFGQVVKATVVLVKGYQPCEMLIKELQEHVKSALAPYKYPRIVEFVERLPQNAAGKVNRTKLRSSFEKKNG